MRSARGLELQSAVQFPEWPESHTVRDSLQAKHLKIAKQHASGLGCLYRFNRGVGAESPGHGPGLSFFLAACQRSTPRFAHSQIPNKSPLAPSTVVISPGESST